ncbi:MAG: hypothetical protein QW385_04170, partial [Thermoproteota archaeon]
MAVWVATGSMQNSKTQGDLLLLYVTGPVRGIVGIARVEEKAEENNILWRDEAVVGRVLYPYRILFKPLFILDEDKWETDKIAVKDLNVSVRAGLNSLRNPDTL